MKNRKFWWKMPKIYKKFDEILLKCLYWSGAKVCKLCRSWKNSSSFSKNAVKPTQTHIFLQNFVLIQPRTSPVRIRRAPEETACLVFKSSLTSGSKVGGRWRGSRGGSAPTASYLFPAEQLARQRNKDWKRRRGGINCQRFDNLADIWRFFKIAVVQKYANLVEFEKCCQTDSNAYFELIFLQNFVLIQPRTSSPKISKH